MTSLYDSAARSFQACFSHSHWLSQPKLHEQTSSQGRFPQAPGGVLAPACLGSAAGTEDPADYSAVDWFFPRMTWRSWAGKSQQLWLCWSFHYLFGTSSTTTHEVCTFQIMKTQNFYHPNNMFCSLASYQNSLWGRKWLTLFSHLSVISWHLIFFFNPAYCGMLFFPVSVPNSDLFSKSQFNVLELCLGKLCSFIFLLTYRRATLFSYTVVHRYKTWARDYLGHGKSWWCFFLHIYCWQMALSVLKYILYFS